MYRVKIYKITFNKYWDYMYGIIKNANGVQIEIGKGNLLIKEDEIEYYRQFGDGIQSLELVGYMLVEGK